MKTSPLMMGAALVFWGWQSGMLLIAVLLAAVLEAHYLIKFRLELTTADYIRIANFCTVLFLGAAVYLVVTRGAAHSIIALFMWLPLLFMPLISAQVYGSMDAIDLSVLLNSSRKKARRKIAVGKVNLTYPYFAICLLSASAANSRTVQFYFGFIALGAWALWFSRSRRYSPVFWTGLLLGIAAFGYVGHVGLHRLQGLVEDASEEWLSWSDGEADPYQATTAIGHIGEMKLSRKIVLRVNTNRNIIVPFLLREASYDTYFQAHWSANNSGFIPIPPAADNKSWLLRPDQPADSMTISKWLQHGKGLLALPGGTVQVADLPALVVKQNRFGAVELEQESDMISYRALFAPSVAVDPPPSAYDLQLPRAEAQVFTNIAVSLRLAEHSQQQIPGIVKKYFQENFRYSTYQRGHDASVSPLTDFILRTRLGHCEYFATATTLLLRAAGIPARYAVGYSVQEFSQLENKYVARARHAHAWSRVYINGVWQDLDATPASWIMDEAENTPAWEQIIDLWYWVTQQFYQWRANKAESTSNYIAWMELPLIIILAWRLYFKKRTSSSSNIISLSCTHAGIGKDSEVYLIERCMAGLGVGRAQGESHGRWLKRLYPTVINQVELDTLNVILELHQRYRFDPAGISAEERIVLRDNTHVWLDSFHQGRTRYENRASYRLYTQQT